MAAHALWIGSGFGFLAVLLGAFGAHALRARLSPDMLAVWKTANEYHFYHALGLLLIGVLARQMQGTALNAAAGLMIAGILLFSGSLYLLSLTGTRWLGAITPIGGSLFLVAWLCLGWAAIKAN